MKTSLIILHWLYPFVRGMFIGLLAMTIHECGHLLAACVLGVRVKTVAFRWKGLCTVRESAPPMKNLLASIAGPLMNSVLVLTWQSSPIFGVANLCFAFFNILPNRGQMVSVISIAGSKLKDKVIDMTFKLDSINPHRSRMWQW